MNNNLLQIKVKERLNKLSSQDYDNIECWQIVEAFNKAQLEWVRRQVHGHNQGKEGSEQTIMNIDDLQILLVEQNLSATQFPLYYETAVIPANYMFYKRISVNAITECCPERPLIVYLAQVADVDSLLSDDFRSPSAKWGETFSTIQSNKFRIYTNGEFNLSTPKLVYYRKPRNISFLGCINPSTGTADVDVECELKDDIVEMVIDEACSIIAGDIELFNQYSRTKQQATINN
jgi:hypothetical protein